MTGFVKICIRNIFKEISTRLFTNLWKELYKKISDTNLHIKFFNKNFQDTNLYKICSKFVS